MDKELSCVCVLLLGIHHDVHGYIISVKNLHDKQYVFVA